MLSDTSYSSETSDSLGSDSLGSDSLKSMETDSDFDSLGSSSIGSDSPSTDSLKSTDTDTDTDSDSVEDAILAAVLAAATTAVYYYENYMSEDEDDDSDGTGSCFVSHFLNGDSQLIYEHCRMDINTFRKLCRIMKEGGYLKDSRKVRVEEQLFIFLNSIAPSMSNRILQKRFQHSGETISRYINTVLDALVDFNSTVISLPDPSVTPTKIANSQKFFPYFKDCLGVLDCTHIPAFADEKMTFGNRKGWYSQNVLAAVTFDGLFSYVLAGWEGIATDAMVLNSAYTKGFEVPAGKYYLGDAGHGISDKVLTPYRGVRYERRKSDDTEERPRNAKELYNLRHSSLRGAVERTFGVLKKRFPILTNATNLARKSQVKLVLALCGLHNFIKRECGEDEFYEEFDSIDRIADNNAGDSMGDEEYEIDASIRDGKVREGYRLRDAIANAMWEDYCQNVYKAGVI